MTIGLATGRVAQRPVAERWTQIASRRRRECWNQRLDTRARMSIYWRSRSEPDQVYVKCIVVRGIRTASARMQFKGTLEGLKFCPMVPI